MEVILERVVGNLGSGLRSALRAWLSGATRREAEARAKRRAERDLARFAREMAGMSEHMRRDIGLEPYLVHAHFGLFNRLD
jgi:hypothetical protein